MAGWHLGAELLAQGRVSRLHKRPDLIGQVFADARKILQLPFRVGNDFRQRCCQVPDLARRVAISSHPEGIGLLNLQQVGHLVEGMGNLGIIHDILAFNGRGR